MTKIVINDSLLPIYSPIIKQTSFDRINHDELRLSYSRKYSLRKGFSVSHCSADLLFDRFRLDQTSKSVSNSTYAKMLNLNPNK